MYIHGFFGALYSLENEAPPHSLFKPHGFPPVPVLVDPPRKNFFGCAYCKCCKN